MKEHLRWLVHCLAAGVFALTFVACDDEDTGFEVETDTETEKTDDDGRELEETDPEDVASEEPEPEETDDVAPTQFTISGQVKRVGTAKVLGDGIGTLCVAVTHSCPGSANPNPRKLGEGVVIKDADLSAKGATISYSATVDTSEAELDKRYFVSAVMKEDGSDCIPVPGEPILRAGDMVGMNCGRFKFQGENVDNVNVNLDWTLEYDI